MKRFIIFIMIIKLCTFGVCAETDIIFDLNIDNFNSTSFVTDVSTIVDGTGNSGIATLKGNSVAKGTFFNANGETKSYLKLTSGGLQFNAPIVTGNLSELSIECWSKLNLSSNDWRNLFSIGETKSSDGLGEKTAMRLTWYKWNSSKIFVYKGAEATSGMVEGYYNNGATFENKWTHYVFTRKWNPNSAQWTITGYANGSLIMNETANGRNSAAVNNFLNIGWNNYDSIYSIGDLGDFRAYKKALTATEVLTKYNDSKNEYIELSNSMNLVSITPVATELSIYEGNISLEFDNIVDKSSLQNGILFTKEDNTPIKGGYYTTANGKTISIAFGTLDVKANYKLVLTSQLKSINSISVTPKQYNFTTGEDSSILLEEDFQGDDYIVGQKPPTNKGVDYGEIDYITVCEENGDKFLKLKGAPNAMVYKIFDNPLIAGAISVEVVMRASSDDDTRGAGTMARDTGRIFWDKTNFSKTSDIMSITSGYPKIINTFSGTIPFTYNEDVDANGFYGIRYTMKKNAITNGFDVEISNLFNSSAGSAIISLDASTGTKIEGILAAHIYPWGSDAQMQLAYDSSEISSLKIYGVFEPKILYTTANNIDPANREITVVFNDDMVGSTVNNSNITLLNKTTKESIPFHISSEYNADDRSVKMMLDQYLDFSTEYEIVCDKVKNMKDSFVSKTQNSSFTTAPYCITATNVEVTRGTNSVTAKATLKNTDLQSKDVLVVCVLYDEEGRMKKIVTTPSNLTLNQSKSISATISNVEIKSGYKARTYILDHTNGYVKAIKMTVDDILFN